MKPLGIIFPQKDQLFAVRFSVNLKLYDLYIYMQGKALASAKIVCIKNFIHHF